MQGVKQLTEEEVAEFEADQQIVMDYASCLRLVKALRLNVQDFVEAVQGYGETFAETYDLPEHLAEEMSSVPCRAAALSSARVNERLAGIRRQELRDGHLVDSWWRFLA
jgi:hypothetical protein